MPPAPLPADEPGRLAALAALELLDTPAEEVFDSFVRVACDLMGAPIGAVSLVAEDRVWFKALQGLPGVTEAPRDVAFCAYTILAPGEVLMVPDLAADPRFADNALVTGEAGLRFYAGAPVTDAAGQPLGALCVIDRAARQPPPEAIARLKDLGTGVSAALRLHASLKSLDALAHRDALTGLGNRRAFEARLAGPAGATGATLLLLDLDDFKGTNDRFGHPAGDAVLREASRRLVASLPPAAEAFRLGGDEFAAMLPEALGDRAALDLAARLHAAFAAPFAIDGVAVALRTSIGAAAQPGPAPAAALVPQADAALYEAKRAGRGCTRVHQRSPEDAPRPAGGAARRPALGPSSLGPSSLVPSSSAPSLGSPLGLEAWLRQALVPGGREPFTLAFQPVVDLRTGRVSSLEALVRWSPQPGLAISPGEFVPLAERTGLVPHLDRWVLNEACRVAASWPGPWRVSVNVSASTFGLEDVGRMVREALDASGLAPDRLVVEMTETAAAGDEAQARRATEAIRAQGARLALDDFGGGHASLTAIRRHPFSTIKVDRALTAGLDRDPVAARMMAFVAELGVMLDMDVVAEGVERDAELRAVRDCGATGAQGYLLARPGPVEGLAGAVAAAEAAASHAQGDTVVPPRGASRSPPPRMAGLRHLHR
jgi:diguanylate cyclase (GGDEF)-like protein